MGFVQGRVDTCVWKVRRMPGSKHTYQVCRFDSKGNAEVIPGYWDSLKGAQEFATAMNQMGREVSKVV